ncbi:MAG: PPC domain-containing protein [Planctomycetes bacterium]|nr:PPC domain-containing protein [Planctomycetota bacterium]MCC7398138.1 PPC domain-containing protein [Planctomycetota bacterium]
MTTRNLHSLAVGLALTASLAAQSNECAGASYLIVGNNGPFSNAGSTTSLPAWPCGNAANDVWFSFQTTTAGNVTVDTCGASIDTVLQVFSGSCGNLVSVGCNDDGCGTASTVTFAAQANTFYRVRVAGYGGVTGSFPVRLQGPVVGGSYAANLSTGRGCVAHPASFYESFHPGTVDLDYSSLTMIPSGGGYFVTQSNPTYLAPSPAAIVLPLGDDTDVTVPLSSPMIHPGGTTSSLVVCSNGHVAIAPGNPVGAGLGAGGMLNAPVTAYYVACDFDPSILFGGRVKFEQVGSKACVTWDGVWDFGATSPAGARTFQFQFDTSNGNVHYVFQTVSSASSSLLVGYSPGGPSYDGGAIDISAATTSSFTLPAVDGLPLTVTPTTRPIIGGAWSMDVTHFPATSTLGIDIIGFTDPGIDDLAAIGLPGCGLRASLDVLGPWAPIGSLHTYSIGVPANPALINRPIHTSAVVFVPGINAFGAITANGVTGQIGDY